MMIRCKFKYINNLIIYYCLYILIVQNTIFIMCSEDHRRECCNTTLDDFLTETTETTTVPTTTPYWKKSGAILNCILARQLCFQDPSCAAILEIIPRVCGPISVACSTVTVTKCRAALKTLQSFPLFKPTCLCKEPAIDPECNSFRDFLFDHPCGFVLKKEKDPYPIDALPTCNHALQVCQKEPQCMKIYNSFKQNCKTRFQKCKMTDRESCNEAWKNLRFSPFFGCICPNNHVKRRCDRIFGTINHNPCIVQSIGLEFTYHQNNVITDDNMTVINMPLISTKAPIFRHHTNHNYQHSKTDNNVNDNNNNNNNNNRDYQHHKNHQNQNHNHHHHYQEQEQHLHYQHYKQQHNTILYYPFNLTFNQDLLTSSSSYPSSSSSSSSSSASLSSSSMDNKLNSRKINGFDREQSSTEITTEQHTEIIRVHFQSTCHTALDACREDSFCKTSVQPVLSHCDIHKCNRNACMEALQTFYRASHEDLSLDIAFCLCKKTQNRHDVCMIAQEKLHPVCAQRAPDIIHSQSSNGAMYYPPPACHMIAKLCKEDEDCRGRLEQYEQACAVDSVTNRCAGRTSSCRSAMLGILGTPLRSSCACHGTDLHQLHKCMSWHRLLWLNPCVVESQKDFHMKRLAELGLLPSTPPTTISTSTISTTTALQKFRMTTTKLPSSMMIVTIPRRFIATTKATAGPMIATTLSTTTNHHRLTSPTLVYLKENHHLHQHHHNQHTQSAQTSFDTNQIEPPDIIPETLQYNENESDGKYFGNENNAAANADDEFLLAFTPNGIFDAGPNDLVRHQPSTVTSSVGASMIGTTATSTTPVTTTIITSTTIAPKYCVVQRPQQTDQLIKEGNTRRIYSIDDVECSELCSCGDTLILTCHALCVPFAPCRTSLAFYSHASPAYQAFRGRCLCYSGRFICMRPPPGDYSLPGGVFLLLGYSSTDEALLRPYTNLGVQDSIRALQHYVMRNVDNSTSCMLTLFNMTDENIIISARLPHDSKITPLELLRKEKAQCTSIVEVISQQVNNQHSELAAHRLLSIFKMGEFQIVWPEVNSSNNIKISFPIMLSVFISIIYFPVVRWSCNYYYQINFLFEKRTRRH